MKLTDITVKQILLDSQRLWDFGNGRNVYFTSDTHWSHTNILNFCDRPFTSIEEMDEELIKRWNNVITNNDIVFHLGDFCFAGPQRWNQILKKLNGKKYLIIGNHDMQYIAKDTFMSETVNYFEGIYQQMNIFIDDWHIYLNHYPFLAYGGAYNAKRKVGQLFGHVHYYNGSQGLDCSRLTDLFPYQYDVGVDNNDFTPVSWVKIKSIFESSGENGYKNMIEFKEENC